MTTPDDSPTPMINKVESAADSIIVFERFKGSPYTLEELEKAHSGFQQLMGEFSFMEFNQAVLIRRMQNKAAQEARENNT